MKFKEGDFVSINNLSKFLTGDAPRQLKEFATISPVNKYVVINANSSLNDSAADAKYYIQTIDSKISHDSYFIESELMLAISDWD